MPHSEEKTSAQVTKRVTTLMKGWSFLIDLGPIVLYEMLSKDLESHGMNQFHVYCI